MADSPRCTRSCTAAWVCVCTLQGFLGNKQPLNCPCNVFVIASLMQINELNVERLPVQNLRGKKQFHIWKRLAIPTIIIDCSFENKTHISETPNYFLKGKWLAYFGGEENTSVVALTLPPLDEGPEVGALGLKRSACGRLKVSFYFTARQQKRTTVACVTSVPLGWRALGVVCCLRTPRGAAPEREGRKAGGKWGRTGTLQPLLWVTARLRPD